MELFAFLLWLVMFCMTSAIKLDTSDPSSIRKAAKTIADETMSYYNGNVSGSGVMVGDLPDPYYWWQAGALWGAMLDYYHYTGDPSYNPTIIQALLAPVNAGPEHDFNPPEHHFELGNDDLAFWGFVVLSAAERNFPQPKVAQPSWLQMGQNIFRTLSSRWNDTHCDGGVLWQVFESNPNGMNYKNSVTNGGLFQLAARLARATGQEGYADWANKAWEWSVKTGLIGKNFNVYDGAHASDNCARVNHVAFTYTAGIYLHGAAVMAAHTGDKKWAERAHKILDAAGHFFGHGEDNKDVMYEPACETGAMCNHDMKSLKGYLSRFMWQSTCYLPSLMPKVRPLLEATSLAAARSCSGGSKGTTCGQKWYVDGYDDTPGLGQQMCALETIQGLLIDEAEPPSRAGGAQVVPTADSKKKSANSTKIEESDGDEGEGEDSEGRDDQADYDGKPSPDLLSGEPDEPKRSQPSNSSVQRNFSEENARGSERRSWEESPTIPHSPENTSLADAKNRTESRSEGDGNNNKDSSGGGSGGTPDADTGEEGAAAYMMGSETFLTVSAGAVVTLSALQKFGEDVIPKTARKSQSDRDAAVTKVPVAEELVRVAHAPPSSEVSQQPREKKDDGEPRESEGAKEKEKDKSNQNVQEESGKDKESGTLGGDGMSNMKCLAPNVVAMAGFMLWL